MRHRYHPNKKSQGNMLQNGTFSGNMSLAYIGAHRFIQGTEAFTQSALHYHITCPAISANLIKPLKNHSAHSLKTSERQLITSYPKLSISEPELFTSNRKLWASERKLSLSHHKLSPSNRKLSASDPKLSLSERKLSASNTKLSLSDHKLPPSERELSFSVRELSASDDKLPPSEAGLLATQRQLFYVFHPLFDSGCEKSRHEPNRLVLGHHFFNTRVSLTPGMSETSSIKLIPSCWKQDLNTASNE
ncbi:MAG: hypothetical protein V4615_00265 [Bacteroidota bacterium]